MSFAAVALITLSAFMHAFWNFLGKRRNPSVAFFLMANVTAALSLSPLLIWYHQTLLSMPKVVWALVLLTGVFQTVYFTGLANAYRHGDMSLAYPLARAVPVLLVALLNLGIGRGHQIGRLGLVGMVLVASGCLILPLTSFRRLRTHGYLTAASAFALLAAVGTTGYTMIDDGALRQLRDSPQLSISDLEVTLLFMALEAASISLVMAIYALLNAKERQLLPALWRGNRFYAGITGLIIMSTYGLVLLSMAYVSNVSYVAAFRQFSIPIGALMGMTLQGEPRYAPKLSGIAIILAGLLMVALG